MVSIGVRRDVTKGQVRELARGFRDAGRRWNIHLVGGDTSEAKELVIDCAMVGFADRIVSRGGASHGDILVVTEPFGFPSSGLQILCKGAKAGTEFSRKAVISMLEPAPNLNVGLALAPFLTSSMDSSDGLARSLHTIAKASGVRFELARLPVGEGVERFAADNGLDASSLVLEGGEEYSIVGTVRKSELNKAMLAARNAGGQLFAIGTAKKGTGVVLKTGSKIKEISDVGWTHLT